MVWCFLEKFIDTSEMVRVNIRNAMLKSILYLVFKIVNNEIYVLWQERRAWFEEIAPIADQVWNPLFLITVSQFWLYLWFKRTGGSGTAWCRHCLFFENLKENAAMRETKIDHQPDWSDSTGNSMNYKFMFVRTREMNFTEGKWRKFRLSAI